MRIARLIFAGSIAALAVASAPALAKNSNSASNANAQKVEDTPVAQGCHAYQQAPDGTLGTALVPGGGPNLASADAAQVRHAKPGRRDALRSVPLVVIALAGTTIFVVARSNATIQSILPGMLCGLPRQARNDGHA